MTWRKKGSTITFKFIKIKYLKINYCAVARVATASDEEVK